MKYAAGKIFLILILCLLLSNNILAQTIEIALDGFRNDQGQVMIYLYDNAEPYPYEPEKAVSSRIVSVKNKLASAIFEDINAGTYAVALIHDENNDGKLDANFFGFPQEGVGASNNALRRFGPPIYEEASFKLEKDARLFITVHY